MAKKGKGGQKLAQVFKSLQTRVELGESMTTSQSQVICCCLWMTIKLIFQDFIQTNQNQDSILLHFDQSQSLLQSYFDWEVKISGALDVRSNQLAPGADHLQPGETNSAELLSQELQSASSSLEGIVLFAPFGVDYIKEDQNDQLFEGGQDARRNQRKIWRQQRRDKEKGNIKKKNTPSREANTVFVNKTQNKPKITNEDSIENMNDKLYRRKPEERRRGKKGRRAKFSPSLLSTISSAGQQLALGQLIIRWQLTSWSYSVFQWSSDQLISDHIQCFILSLSCGLCIRQYWASGESWSRQTCSVLASHLVNWALVARKSEQNEPHHSRCMMLLYSPQRRQKRLGGWLHGPRYSKS